VRRLWLAALAAALLGMAMPAAAAATEPCAPSFEGVMTFPAIQGTEDPEEFCWEVSLAENQELRQVDHQHAAVFYVAPEHEAFLITAELAHDASGAEVPTTLAVVQPNVVVLTVHHLAGDPSAGGAPFDYPVTAGEGWEGGFEPVEIKGPLDEAELKVQPLPPPTEEAPPHPPTCEVPDLQGRTLKSARRALARAGCKLGSVHGHRHPGARIVKQYRPAYTVRPAGSTVGVKLGR
jgi:hypothetical protein